MNNSIACTYEVFVQSGYFSHCKICQCMLKTSNIQKHLQKKGHIKNLNYIQFFLRKYNLNLLTLIIDKSFKECYIILIIIWKKLYQEKLNELKIFTITIRKQMI
jgi:hypothetical protein